MAARKRKKSEKIPAGLYPHPGMLPFVEKLLGYVPDNEPLRDKIAAVAGPLADETDRLVFRDWLQEHGLFTWGHVLALVLAHPDCDAFRYLAADVLQEEGHLTQAEFVRLDVELASLEPQIKVGHVAAGPRVVYQKVSNLRYGVVKKRRNEIWSAWANAVWPTDAAECPVPGLDWEFWREHHYAVTFEGDAVLPNPVKINLFVVKRGFVEIAYMPDPDWQDFGEELLRNQPLVRYENNTVRGYNPFYPESSR